MANAHLYGFFFYVVQSLSNIGRNKSLLTSLVYFLSQLSFYLSFSFSLLRSFSAQQNTYVYKRTTLRLFPCYLTFIFFIKFVSQNRHHLGDLQFRKLTNIDHSFEKLWNKLLTNTIIIKHKYHFIYFFFNW